MSVVNTLDIIFIVFMVLVIIVGALRGTLKELLALAVWGLAFFGAFYGYEYIYKNISIFHDLAVDPSLQRFWAFSVLFVVLFVILSIIKFFVCIFIPSLGVILPFRILGMLIAAIKGMFIIYIVALFMQQLVVHPSEMIKDSKVLQHTHPYLVVIVSPDKASEAES